MLLGGTYSLTHYLLLGRPILLAPGRNYFLCSLLGRNYLLSDRKEGLKVQPNQFL